ncbi:MAG: carbohydrate ABC transporter permease [Sphaerochaetaceae bacterium]|nr:carbohydrate ABC transporter permease [Sphaerochaetaceae bacterium]
MSDKMLTVSSRRSRVLINSVLVVFSFFWIFPVIFALLGIMKSKKVYNLTNFWEFAPDIQLLENYRFIVEYSNILQGMINSLFYGAVGALIAVIFSMMAAYALAKLRIGHRMFWFMLIYSGTIFPFQLYLIPVFKAYQRVGLYDTRVGMMLFYSAICIPFAMFVLRNFFIGVSDEIMEAARIDGADNWKILWRILFPMAKPSISVVLLTQFAFSYNDLMFGITFTTSSGIKPIMATISTFQDHIPAMLLACIIVSIPSVLLYSFLNRNFDEGIAYTSK